ncbi:hypothetical protein DW828_10655 [Parabacteroides merdae]|uniref:Uncharacterized protein n=1 Tax=Parabacteroides merdae TaxID=46503 RepID=A0A414BXV5_9BACT|nr:hypothetical protein DW828_10655 [Parabacteroides merdae]
MAYIFRDILLTLKNKGKKKRSEDFFWSFTSCPIRVYEKDSKSHNDLIQYMYQIVMTLIS